MVKSKEDKAKKQAAKEDEKVVKAALKNAKRGYTPLKGAKDTRVDINATIYTNTSLYSVTRLGKLDEVLSSNRTQIVKRAKSYQSANEDLVSNVNSADKKAGKDVQKKTFGLMKGSIIKDTSAIVQERSKEYYSATLSELAGPGENSPTAFSSISTDFSQLGSGEAKLGFTSNSIGQKMLAREAIDSAILSEIKKATAVDETPVESIENNSGASEEAPKKDPHPGRTLAKKMASTVKEARKAVDAVVASKVQGVAKWFAEQEAIIDALPTMSDFGSEVYIVEFRKDYEVTLPDGTKESVSDWFYTGETTVMDRQANQRVQELKAEVCARLTKHVDKVNEFVNGLLEDQVKKCKQCQIFITIINLIKQLPSLTTIIKWAKSIIDSFIEVYKMIFGMFKAVMEIIELVIIKGPQLINKLMKKITEFNCPVNFSINVNSKGDK